MTSAYKINKLSYAFLIYYRDTICFLSPLCINIFFSFPGRLSHFGLWICLVLFIAFARQILFSVTHCIPTWQSHWDTKRVPLRKPRIRTSCLLLEKGTEANVSTINNTDSEKGSVLKALSHRTNPGGEGGGRWGGGRKRVGRGRRGGRGVDRRRGGGRGGMNINLTFSEFTFLFSVFGTFLKFSLRLYLIWVYIMMCFFFNPNMQIKKNL